MLTYDASGNPVAITGTDGQVATSAGADAVSAFEAAGGITEADTWRVTTSFTGGVNPITANWERDDSYGNGLLGTGMSESSGIFTFPSTGYWLVDYHAKCSLDGTSNYNNYAIRVSVDNGASFSEAAYGCAHLNEVGANHVAGAHSSKIFSVSSITGGTTFQVAFMAEVQNASTTTFADSTTNITYATFIRLGDV